MIVDWKKAGERVLSEGKLPDERYYERHRKKSLEIAAMREMIGRGLGMEEARLMWNSLGNGTRADLEPYGPMTIDGVFLGEWVKAKRLGAFTGYAMARISDSELAYLGELRAPYVIRRYWGGLLCWIKARKAAGELPEARGDVQAWIWETVNPGKKWANAKKGVAKWSERCGRPFPIEFAKKGRKTKTVWVAPWASPIYALSVVGDPADGVSPEECDKVADAVCRASFICPECGRRYDWSGNGKASGLCPICQIKRERNANAERVRKNRKKKNADK